MFIGWDKLKIKLDAGRIDQEGARSLIMARFGSDRMAYHFEGERIVVALSPPRPP